jgi:hypothetical protein
MKKLQRDNIQHITETKYKLKEAKYFLRLLSRNKKRGEQFDFLLNAFVNSARSITWVMRAEFSKIPQWESWYEERKVVKSEKNILDLFNALRINATKKQPLRTHFLVDMKIPKELLNRSLSRKLDRLKGKKLKITISPNRGRKPIQNARKISFAAYLTSVKRSVMGFADKDILSLCLRYLTLLDDLVKQCISKFGKSITLSKSRDHNMKVRY